MLVAKKFIRSLEKYRRHTVTHMVEHDMMKHVT